MNDKEGKNVTIEMAALMGGGDESNENENQEASSPSQELENVNYARRLLYCSHFFAQFSEVSWQFSVALFLAACTNYQSLALVSTYGIALGLAVCLAGARLGRWIDTSDRIVVVRKLIFLENAAVVLGTVCCYILLSEDPYEGTDQEDGGSSNSWFQNRFAHIPSSGVAVASLVGIHVFGTTAQVLDQSFLVAIERDWVVVIGEAASGWNPEATEVELKEWLSDTNVAMKQIDLNCKVAAPGIAGFVISKLAGGEAEAGNSELQWACLFVGGLNALALLVEYVCTVEIHRLIPGLSHKTSFSKADPEDCTHDDDDSPSDSTVLMASVTKRHFRCTSYLRLPDALELYMEQSICWGGASLALLYMNALTFGNGIMTAYLLSQHVKLELVGILRSVASAIGLLGTFVYQFSASRLTLETTGMWSVALQFGCLLVCQASLYVGGMSGVALLVGGVCTSRVGLWVFDIAVTQMQQQEIPEHARGVIGGVQQALNAFFNLLSFSLGLVFPDPQDFVFFVVAGCVSVGLATLLFASGVYWPRLVARQSGDY